MQFTRRTFLRVSGAVTAGIIGSTGIASAAAANGWTEVDSPTSKGLNSVVLTDDDSFAVGSSGRVLERDTVTGDWEILLKKGPSGEGNTLNGAAVTDDGERFWFAGGSGSVGEYDVVTDTLVDYSEPLDKTSTWEDVAVQGLAGENERLYLANGSGEVLIGERADDGGIDWLEVIKPGGGSTIPGINFHDRLNGHVASTSQAVFETNDGGNSWTQIGVKDTNVSFYDIASVADDDINIAAGSGRIFYYNGDTWTPVVLSENAIRAIDRDSEFGLAAGSGGLVYERESETEWTVIDTPVSAKLKGVSNDPTNTFPDVAVGSSGTIIERSA